MALDFSPDAGWCREQTRVFLRVLRVIERKVATNFCVDGWLEIRIRGVCRIWGRHVSMNRGCRSQQAACCPPFLYIASLLTLFQWPCMPFHSLGRFHH